MKEPRYRTRLMNTVLCSLSHTHTHTHTHERREGDKLRAHTHINTHNSFLTSATTHSQEIIFTLNCFLLPTIQGNTRTDEIMDVMVPYDHFDIRQVVGLDLVLQFG